MKYEIYQLNTELENGLEMLFMGYRWNTSEGHQITSDKYNKVYEGEINKRSDGYELEHLFATFNLNRPADFKGHGMSVSDVVVLDGKAYYCDRFGFKELPDFFDK